MNILSFVQKNRLFIHYLTIAVVISGVVIFSIIQREARPNVNFNRVNVSVAYPGASASDMEELIIDPIEEKIGEVDGIEEYRSVSYTGAAAISIQIDDAYPNPSEIVDEIRRKITEVRDLPLGMNAPLVSEVKANNIPVLNLALYGSLSAYDFKLETEKFKDFLQIQEGVQSVSYSGISDLQLKVVADSQKLSQFDITLDEVLTGLSNWTKQRPGGLFESHDHVANITIGEDLKDLDRLGDFIVRSNDSGKSIKLKDIASISYDLETIQTGSIFGDKDAVLFTVVKKPFSDAITVVDNLKEAATKYEKRLNSGLKVQLYKDQSIRIRNKLDIVYTNAVSGLILVLIILLVFLDWRSAVVTSIGIPVAILGGIVVLYLMGHTMNSLVVVGMIIVLGMLVDDAIVVCENIYSYIEKGLKPSQAVYKGVSEIALPVIASVLTTVFAFLPIVFMGEIIGQFLRVIPITVIALLTISLLEALFILPIHAEEIMRVKPKTDKVRFFQKIEKVYAHYIHWSLRWRWPLTIILIIFFALSAYQGKKIFERFSLFPAEGLEGLSVRIELENNLPLQKTREMARELSDRMIAVSDGTFDNIYSSLGQVTTGGNSGSRQNGAHLGMINVTFTSDPSFIYKERKITADINRVVNEFKKEKGINASVTLDRPGPPIGKPIQLQVTSRDFVFGRKIVDDIISELKKMKGVHSLETDLDGSSLKYRIRINNELAISEGVDPLKISRTIFASSTGSVASEVLSNNEKIEILLVVDNKGSQSFDEVLKLKVRNNHGQAVPLSTFVKIDKEYGPSSIQRLNGLRTITLFGEVDEAIISGKEVNANILPYIKEIKENNPTIDIVVGGGEKDRLNALKDTMKLYIFAIIMIFMIISLTFQSVIYPFLVLITIPMGLSGVVWSLLIHGKSLSIMGIIGIVGLSGVVVNVSIIFLKFVQDRLREGVGFRESIIEAGVTRLRPITMTTISTLLGLIPTIYGVGGVDTFVQPIALVLGWGLFVATFLTLLFLPAAISFFTILKKVSQDAHEN